MGVVGCVVSAYLMCAQLGVLVADATGSTITGVVSGVAGAGILGGIGVQMLRNSSKSEKFHDAQIARHVTEINRLSVDLDRCRARCEQLDQQLARRDHP